MRKFKLIKKYPGCAWSLGNGPTNTQFIWDNNKKVYLKDYPEFWEEVITKEYEILAWKRNGKIFTKIDPKTNLKKGHIFCKEGTWLSISTLLGNNFTQAASIYSVKRLSDGEIFTVGDTIGVKGEIINEFEYSIDYLRVWFVHPSYSIPTKPGETPSGFPTGNMKWNNLSYIKSAKPLFTTEDGVDVFEDINGEFRYWRLNIPSPNTNPRCVWMISNAPVICKNIIPHNTEITRKAGVLRFSTKEAAEEYILMNKPCISLNDIFGNSNLEEDSVIWYGLRDLVKKKCQ